MSKPSWIGATLKGRYRIDEMLGQGGMSAVFRATDPNLKRVVAVKLIHAHLSNDPKFITRFEEEAAAVAQLRHPNIVQVYDFDRDEDTYYIILEFIPGETLNDRLKRLNQSGRHLPVEEALKILIQICEAVNYAHQRGMVHRDIKPANIMLNVNHQAILMDFGIVKILGGEKHTATGAVLGTALYMSPEQVRGEIADPRSDIYSLGVTLFESLSGNPPFQADSVMTVLMMHLTDPVPDLRNLRSDVPLEVVKIIERAMAKDPQQRYQSAAEMANDMRSVLAHYSDGIVEKNLARTAESADSTVLESPESAPSHPSTLIEKPRPAIEPEPMQSPAFESRGSLSVKPPIAGDTGPIPKVQMPASPSAGVSARITPPLAAGSAKPVSAGGGSAVSRPGVAGPTGKGPVKTLNGFPWLLAAGGGMGVILILGLIVFVVIVGLNANRARDDQALLAAHATQTAVTRLLVVNTVEPSPTPSLAPGIETATLPAATLPTSTISPTDTPTMPPMATFTPTVPPGILYVRINQITIDEFNRYVVEYETFEYTESLPGVHIHFFYNTVPPDQAGMPGSGPWILYGGPRPFLGLTVKSRPENATQICALVANPNHTVQPGSGNCVDLP